MLAFGLLLTRGVFAATAAVRIVLVQSSNVELARKVRAEAEHAGILVASEPGTAAQGDAELLQRHDAVGVVELLSPDRVRIHVAPAGEHAAYDTIVERAPADGDGFPVRVVEQVRGRLVELKLLPPNADEGPSSATGAASAAGSATEKRAPSDVNVPPPEVDRGPGRTIAPTQAPTLGLTVGGAATAASGGMGTTPSAALGLRLEPVPHWAASLHALLPVAENDVFAPEGQASVRVNLLFAELGYRLLPGSASIQPEVGAGAGVVVLPMEAETVPPLEAHTDRLVAGIYFLQAGVGFALEPWLRLRAGVRGGVSAPRPVVEFSDEAVASWGRGFVVATLEAELRLPLSSNEAGP